MRPFASVCQQTFAHSVSFQFTIGSNHGGALLFLSRPNASDVFVARHDVANVPAATLVRKLLVKIRPVKAEHSKRFDAVKGYAEAGRKNELNLAEDFGRGNVHALHETCAVGRYLEVVQIGNFESRLVGLRKGISEQCHPPVKGNVQLFDNLNYRSPLD